MKNKTITPEVFLIKLSLLGWQMNYVTLSDSYNVVLFNCKPKKSKEGEYFISKSVALREIAERRTPDKMDVTPVAGHIDWKESKCISIYDALNTVKWVNCIVSIKHHKKAVLAAVESIGYNKKKWLGEWNCYTHIRLEENNIFSLWKEEELVDLIGIRVKSTIFIKQITKRNNENR